MSAVLVDLTHGCHAAGLIADAARRNPTSVGCHYLATREGA
jgi:hypothetical protein